MIAFPNAASHNLKHQVKAIEKLVQFGYISTSNTVWLELTT